MQVARQAGDGELADAMQMIVSVLDGKLAMLEELDKIHDRLSTGTPNAATMQDAADSLEAMAQACLVSCGIGGELHDLGRAALIGAVQKGMTEFHDVLHRQDMARAADLQSQLDRINFANDLTVDWTSVDGMRGELSVASDGMYSQEVQAEREAASRKLEQSADISRSWCA